MRAVYPYYSRWMKKFHFLDGFFVDTRGSALKLAPDVTAEAGSQVADTSRAGAGDPLRWGEDPADRKANQIVRRLRDEFNACEPCGGFVPSNRPPTIRPLFRPSPLLRCGGRLEHLVPSRSDTAGQDDRQR